MILKKKRDTPVKTQMSWNGTILLIVLIDSECSDDCILVLTCVCFFFNYAPIFTLDPNFW